MYKNIIHKTLLKKSQKSHLTKNPKSPISQQRTTGHICLPPPPTPRPFLKEVIHAEFCAWFLAGKLVQNQYPLAHQNPTMIAVIMNIASQIMEICTTTVRMLTETNHRTMLNCQSHRTNVTIANPSFRKNACLVHTGWEFLLHSRFCLFFLIIFDESLTYIYSLFSIFVYSSSFPWVPNTSGWCWSRDAFHRWRQRLFNSCWSERGKGRIAVCTELPS